MSEEDLEVLRETAKALWAEAQQAAEQFLEATEKAMQERVVHQIIDDLARAFVDAKRQGKKND